MISKATLDKIRKIKLIVFDVDGVLTDGKIILGENGNEYKSFHVHDGLGMVLLLKHNIEVAIITARQSKIVENRMQALGIKYIYQGQDNKEQAILDLLNKSKLDNDQIAYLGDDIIDLPAMKHCGLKMAVHNAHDSVKQYCDYVTTTSGGNGAAREVCELILNIDGKLDDYISQQTK